MWYTLFFQESGAYMSHTPVATTPNSVFGVVSRPTEPNEVTEQWNATTRSWVLKPGITARVLSRKEFLDRFTQTELTTCMALLRNTDNVIYGAFASFVLYVVVSTAIDLDEAQTVAGLAFLNALGILSVLRVQAIRGL